MSAATVTCPDGPTLRKYRDNALEPAFERWVEDHLQVCAACQQRLNDVSATPPSRLPTAVVNALRTPPIAEEDLPAAIDELGFQVLRLLGRGSFGLVFLALDEQLDRQVAIKISAQPLRDDREPSEARLVASFDHSGIVPVYEAGRLADGRGYFVSKYVDGGDLATRLKEDRPPYAESAKIVAGIAEALHYAHTRGLVHRDVKPANILLDKTGKAYLADFGLALNDDQVAFTPALLGTVPYMSPEQARREGHLLDGRSDIFSLGVVLYELLTGRRPFRADTVEETLQKIVELDPRPPRMWDDRVPRELERICLKALAKRATCRYATASDFAGDLRHSSGSDGRDATTIDQRPDESPIRVVPKGVRSFDAGDADFFLSLLPGPRDRHGVPESVRFWTRRIEETHSERTFRIGLVYGPSGCGKSSLIKAGILPRLAGNVAPLYLEATPHDTDVRLREALRRLRRDESDESLPALIAAFRSGSGLASGAKLLVVLDQFEQALHGGPGGLATLIAALRQCDGGRVQALLIVRDEFWMAVTQLGRELDTRFSEGENSLAVDLFDERHARRVLTEFGRAFGALPEAPLELTRDQRRFVDQVVAEMSQGGKIIPVRLALFAEMTKGKTWTPETLRALGGAHRVGAGFLEECLGAASAPLEHRVHARAARAVLRALMPEDAGNLRANCHSYEHLREASGYGSRPRDFDELLGILDSKLRLVTPADHQTPGCSKPAPDATVQHAHATVPHATGPRERFYQLTHDYLVPSLREWLTDTRTWRGRAARRLEERAAQWKHSGDRRFLPNPFEYAGIVCAVPRSAWTPVQGKMMRAATLRYGLMAAVCTLIGLLAGWAAREWNGTARAEGLLREIRSAPPQALLRLVQDDLPPYRRWADPKLKQLVQDPQADPSAGAVPMSDRWKIHLALLPADADQIEALWAVLRDAAQPEGVRFRAGVGLSAGMRIGADVPAADWTEEEVRFLARQLVKESSSDQAGFRPLLQPLVQLGQRALLDELLRLAVNEQEVKEFEREMAAEALAELSGRADERNLAVASVQSTPRQFEMLHKQVSPEARKQAWNEILDESLPESGRESALEEARVRLGIRRALAAIGCARMGEFDTAMKALRIDDDPESLTQFVHQFQAYGVSGDDIWRFWRHVNELRPQSPHDVELRYALLLCLGRCSAGDFKHSPARPVQAQQIAALFRDDPRAAVHGAARWMLTQWSRWLPAAEFDCEQAVRRVEQTPREYSVGREWFVRRIGDHCETFIAFPGGTLRMGSPTDERRRNDDESLGNQTVAPFAISDREVTCAMHTTYADFLRGLKKSGGPAYDERAKYFAHLAGKQGVVDGIPEISREYMATGEHPIINVDWFEAIDCCRWLTAQQIAAGSMTADDQHYSEAQAATFTKEGDWPTRESPSRRRGYRLPTEAEWEYACRCGRVLTPYSFGSDRRLLPQYAWYGENKERPTKSVCQRMPSPSGLFDMHGNALEWCSTRHTLNPQHEHFPRRILRGGGWVDFDFQLRSAHRFRYYPNHDHNGFGFRLACSLPELARQRVP